MPELLTYEDFFYPMESPKPTPNLQIRLTLYNNQIQQTIFATEFQELKDLISQNDFNCWLEIHGLKSSEDLKEISEFFNIDFLIQQDILNKNHPTKIEFREKFIFLISKIFENNHSEQLHEEQITILCGERFVLCFEEFENHFFESVHEAISNNTLNIRSQNSEYLFFKLIKEISQNHISTIQNLSDQLEFQEDVLLAFKNSQTSSTSLQNFRHQYTQLKKNIPVLLQEFQKFEQKTIHKNMRPFFNDLLDHLKMSIQNLEATKENLDSIVELYVSNMNLKLNEIIKRLTIISTIFIPLTFMAGIWGMNFKYMPELYSPYGYPLAIISMAITGLLIYLYFRNHDW